MDRKSVSRKSERTPAETVRLREVRTQFQREKPSLDTLLASGDYGSPRRQGEVLAAMSLAARLKGLRQSKNLSLAEVAAKSGIDKAQLSRIENGLNANPTLSTLDTVVRALGAQLRFVIEDSPAP